MAREIRNLQGEVIGVVGDKHLSDSEESGGLSLQPLALTGGGVLLLHRNFHINHCPQNSRIPTP